MAESLRSILHIDMDAFFAAIEQRDNPELRGQPVIVGGLGTRGVVSTASYEARKFRVHSALPMHKARERCPAGHFLAVRMAHYQAISQQVFAEFARFTPVIEGLSLDEAFLDLTGTQKLHGSALQTGRELKKCIHTATGLIASVGIGPNKLLAKFASELGKPDGLYEITAAQAEAVLDPLPIGDLWGIGQKTAPGLIEAGIKTIGDLRRAPLATLYPALGRQAARYQRLAAGLDERPVASNVQERSISAENTFATDIQNKQQLQQELLRQAETVASRLRAQNLLAGSMGLKLRTPDFMTHTRARQLRPATNDTRQLYQNACELLDLWRGENPQAALRLLGIATSKLQPADQLDLFAAPANSKSSDPALDAIRQRFGTTAVTRGRLLPQSGDKGAS